MPVLNVEYFYELLCIPLHYCFVWVMCTKPLTCCSWFLSLSSFFPSFFLSCLPKSVGACWAIEEKMHSIELRGKLETRQSRFFQEWSEHVQCGLLKGYCLGYCTHPQYRHFAKVNFNLSKTTVICQIQLFILFVSIQLHSMIIYRIKLIFGLLWLPLCQ